MHPILAQKRNLALYLVSWAPIAGLMTALLVYSGHLGWWPALAFALPLIPLYAFICLAGWYLCKAFPITRATLARLVCVHAVAALLSSAAWVLAGRAWVNALSPLPSMAELNRGYSSQVPMLLGIGALLFILTVSVHYLMNSFEVSRQAEKRALELQVLAREAELKALKAQVDPHFLFNSLNSISALTTVDPPRARNMCLLLADFLRKSLALGARTLIPLEEEIALVSCYLAVEQVRLGPRLSVEKAIDEASKSCRIPPLLLQPLVENAIHHGVANLLEGGAVRIRTELRGGRLSVAIENPVDQDTRAGSGKGLGLENVRNRLAIFYGPEARMALHRTDRNFLVEISLPVG